MMRLIIFSSAFALLAGSAFSQKSLKELLDDQGKEKIKKSVLIEQAPVTAGGYDDGHGRNPLLTSKNQLPDTIALITFYAQDIGSSNTVHNVSITYHSLTGEGGNYFANEIYKKSISTLKEKFKQQGAVLLTPEEFLNTKAKRDYYFKEFQPTVSKLGNFLSGIENKQVDIVAGANGFRIFDVAAAWDVLRAESIGGELAKKLGVKGVLSIQLGLQDDGGKRVNLNQIKIALNGPNPVAKQDKKYVAQNLGNGYYYGNIYSYSNYTLKKPVEIAVFKKKQLEGANVEGIEIILESMIEKMYESMHESIDKAAKKYK
jgi:hypothetical protein